MLIKTILISFVIILNSCSLYELREVEVNIPESENNFKEQDDFDAFIRNKKDHE
jgi:hypothetical protein